MPKGTRVHQCVEKLRRKGMSEGKAIRICQASTKQGYQSGKRIKG